MVERGRETCDQRLHTQRSYGPGKRSGGPRKQRSGDRRRSAVCRKSELETLGSQVTFTCDPIGRCQSHLQQEGAAKRIVKDLGNQKVLTIGNVAATFSSEDGCWRRLPRSFRGASRPPCWYSAGGVEWRALCWPEWPGTPMGKRERGCHSAILY